LNGPIASAARSNPEATAVRGVAAAGAEEMPSAKSLDKVSCPAVSTSRLSGKYRKNVLLASPARSEISATFPIEQISEAATLQAGRHVHGKIVVTLRR
jgi:hypothetical protein